MCSQALGREEVIKGIQECDLNGGRIGNCPYKGILLLLKEQPEIVQCKDCKMENEKVTIEFHGDDLNMILKYKEQSGAIDIRTAIMNAISIALDDEDWRLD